MIGHEDTHTKKKYCETSYSLIKACQLFCVYLQNTITQARKRGEQLVNTIKC